MYLCDIAIAQTSIAVVSVMVSKYSVIYIYIITFHVSVKIHVLCTYLCEYSLMHRHVVALVHYVSDEPTLLCIMTNADCRALKLIALHSVHSDVSELESKSEKWLLVRNIRVALR